MPGYGEIRLSRTLMKPVFRQIEAAEADAIHIATEGPLGIMARRWCRKNGVPFSTAYHTQFPEYLRARLPVPLRISYRFLRWFHGAARYCLVGTPHLKELLEQRGFTNAVIWTKGVDTELFHPDKRQKPDYPAPVFLYVGRVAVEKNIRAFLDLELPGTKLVVGSGPSLERLRAEYPETVFTGPKQGEELARTFAAADAFVFPSRTDTFGLVLLEALASGTPVAAFPVTGPIDVIGDAPVGVLDEDLKAAALGALKVDRVACRAYAERFSWAASTDQFLEYLPSRGD
jgi:glycosyltransferase involved in cell wall biosynthesis